MCGGGSTLKGKNLHLLVQILFFTSRPSILRVTYSAETNRNSCKPIYHNFWKRGKGAFIKARASIRIKLVINTFCDGGSLYLTFWLSLFLI